MSGFVIASSWDQAPVPSVSPPYASRDGLNRPPSAVIDVQDPQLHAPVTFALTDLEHTVGLQNKLASRANGGGGGPTFRVCEQHSTVECPLGSECTDAHVSRVALNEVRTSILKWLADKEHEFGQQVASCAHNPISYKIFCSDLKEIVDVPATSITFTRGLFADPGVRTNKRQTASSAQGSSSGVSGKAADVNSAAASTPTACGLFASDPALCKWGKWCNQAHIDPQFLSRRKQVFNQWAMGHENTFNTMPPDALFLVHDPVIKRSVDVQRQDVAEFTRGLFQQSGTSSGTSSNASRKAPSLCLLFQKRRCTAGACCNQIHVKPEAVSLIRMSSPQGHGLGGRGMDSMQSHSAAGSMPQRQKNHASPYGGDAHSGQSLNLPYHVDGGGPVVGGGGGKIPQLGNRTAHTNANNNNMNNNGANMFASGNFQVNSGSPNGMSGGGPMIGSGFVVGSGVPQHVHHTMYADPFGSPTAPGMQVMGGMPPLHAMGDGRAVAQSHFYAPSPMANYNAPHHTHMNPPHGGPSPNFSQQAFPLNSGHQRAGFTTNPFPSGVQPQQQQHMSTISVAPYRSPGHVDQETRPQQFNHRQNMPLSHQQGRNAPPSATNFPHHQQQQPQSSLPTAHPSKPFSNNGMRGNQQRVQNPSYQLGINPNSNTGPKMPSLSFHSPGGPQQHLAASRSNPSAAAGVIENARDQTNQDQKGKAQSSPSSSSGGTRPTPLTVERAGGNDNEETKEADHHPTLLKSIARLTPEAFEDEGNLLHRNTAGTTEHPLTSDTNNNNLSINNNSLASPIAQSSSAEDTIALPRMTLDEGSPQMSTAQARPGSGNANAPKPPPQTLANTSQSNLVLPPRSADPLETSLSGTPALGSSGVMRKRNNPYEPAQRMASPTSPPQRPDASNAVYNLSNSSFTGVGVNNSFINHLVANSPNASRSQRPAGEGVNGYAPCSPLGQEGRYHQGGVGGFSQSHARAPSGNQHFNQSLGQRPPSRQASYVGPVPEFSFTPLLGANPVLGNDSFNFDPVFGSFAEHPDANSTHQGPAMSESFAMRPEMGSGRAGYHRNSNGATNNSNRGHGASLSQRMVGSGF